MGFLGILAESSRRQLILVADEYNSLWIEFKGNQTGKLGALTCLIHDQVVNLIFADIKLVNSSRRKRCEKNLAFEN